MRKFAIDRAKEDCLHWRLFVFQTLYYIFAQKFCLVAYLVLVVYMARILKSRTGGYLATRMMGHSTSLDGLVVEHSSLPVVTLLEVAFLWRT